MAKTMYSVRHKETGKVIETDWQNAFELVNHGFWTWAKGNGAKEYRTAQREAMGTNPQPQGFEHLGDVPETSDDDDEDYQPVVSPPRTPKPSIQEIADAAVVDDDADGLEDMSREELFAALADLDVKVDKRTGTKNLINMIRAAKEASDA